MKSSTVEFDPNNYPLNSGVRLIEASAGTGKTFTLAHLVLRLITENEYPINQILVVSFTKATAAEIKSKISERITLALKGLETDPNCYDELTIDDVLKEWLKKNSNNKSQLLKWSSLLLNALSSLDNADITTIHGFCNKILTRDALETRSTLEPPSTTEEENYELIKSIVRDFWKTHVLNMHPYDLRGIQQAGITIEKLTLSLLEVDNDPSLQFNLNEDNIDISKSLVSQFNKCAEKSWNDFAYYWHRDGINLDNNLKNLAQSLRDQGINNTKPYSPKPRKNRYLELSEWIMKLTKYMEEHDNSRPFYKDIRSQNLIKDYFHPQKAYEILRRNKLDVSKVINTDLQVSIASLWNSPSELLFKYSLACTLSTLKETRQKNGIVSYGDQLRALDPKNNDLNISSSQSLLKKISFEYRVALIDEFQDTDPVQWRIFKGAFGTYSRNLLLMVGDPKQAIYKFRGGDLNTYLQAKSEVDRCDSLLTNYRAAKPLVNTLNNLMSIGLVNSNLNVPRLSPGSTIETLKLVNKITPLEIMTIKDDHRARENENSKFSKSYFESKIPNAVANSIIELLLTHKKELELDDICILVRSHIQAEDIRESLSKAGLPTRLINKRDVFNSEAAYLLQRLLNCLSNPTLVDNIKTLACSPILQWNLESLNTLKKEKSINELIEKFKSWSDNLKEIGLIGCISELLESQTLGILAQRERLFSDLFQCAQIVEKVIHLNDLDAKGAARWFKQERLRGRDMVPDERRANSDIAEVAINVMTIHRSKGLQFKVVVCPYLWQAPPLPKGPLWRIESSQNWLLSFNTNWGEGENIMRTAIDESIQEAERLAYVALTRAQKHLIVFWCNASNQENNPLKNFLFGPKRIPQNIDELTLEKMKEWLNKNNIKAKLHSINADKLNNYWIPNKKDHELTLGCIPQRTLDTNWGRYSYSSWTSNKFDSIDSKVNPESIEEGRDFDQRETQDKIISQSETGEELDEKLECRNWSESSPLEDFPKGPLAGDCLHKILERIDFSLPINHKGTYQIILEELRKSDIDQNLAENVRDCLHRVLNTPLVKSVNINKLGKIKNHHKISELNFDLSLSRDGKRINSGNIASIIKNVPEGHYLKDYYKKITNLNISSHGFLTGSIDLVFPDQDEVNNSKWWVVDWKSNWIGNNTNKNGKLHCGPSNYNQSRMQAEMIHHHYPLQALLYLVALHRFLLWRLPDYSPKDHLGGYVYVFLRGLPSKKEIEKNSQSKNIPGIIIEETPIEIILDLDNLIKNGPE